MTENERDQDRYWEEGWEGHELAQARRMAQWSLAQKLEWLEEAHHLVEQLQQRQRSEELEPCE